MTSYWKHDLLSILKYINSIQYSGKNSRIRLSGKDKLYCFVEEASDADILRICKFLKNFRYVTDILTLFEHENSKHIDFMIDG